MNITLSADESIIEKSREYAKKHNTSLNKMIREYLSRIAAQDEVENVIAEFKELSLNNSGTSPSNFNFNRENIYKRKS